MDFPEFQEAVCALAQITIPNPYEPFAHRLERFLKHYFLPLAKGGEILKRTRRRTTKLKLLRATESN
jgi:hypothetical protein